MNVARVVLPSPGGEVGQLRPSFAGSGSWPGFADRTDAGLARPSGAAYAIIARHHRAGAAVARCARALHAPNSHQVLGADLDDPAHVLVCWTPDGTLDGRGPRSGGTGQAIRVARAAGVGVGVGVGVVNLAGTSTARSRPPSSRASSALRPARAVRQCRGRRRA